MSWYGKAFHETFVHCGLSTCKIKVEKTSHNRLCSGLFVSVVSSQRTHTGQAAP
jgi:hypothetical protein